MTLRRLQQALIIVALAVAALYVGRTLAGPTGIYRAVLTDGLLVRRPCSPRTRWSGA